MLTLEPQLKLSPLFQILDPPTSGYTPTSAGQLPAGLIPLSMERNPPLTLPREQISTSPTDLDPSREQYPRTLLPLEDSLTLTSNSEKSPLSKELLSSLVKCLVSSVLLMTPSLSTNSQPSSPLPMFLQNHSLSILEPSQLIPTCTFQAGTWTTEFTLTRESTSTTSSKRNTGPLI